MKIGESCTVKIEKLTNLGEGIARLDGFVIFVKNACPDDVLKIKISKLSKNYAHGEIEEIVSPSKSRITPFCPMQKICGSCQLQFIEYKKQLEIKREIVQEEMNKNGIDIEIQPVTESPEIKNYRRKIQYPVSQTKNSKRIIAGYYKQSSHELVNIKYCPIQPEICDKIIEFIKETSPKCKVSGYIESKHTGDLRHIIVRSSRKTGKNLVVLVATNQDERLKNLAKSIYEAFKEVSGVCININEKKTNVIMGNKTISVIGEEFIEENLLDKTFLIGAETFFQVNVESAENIFKYVKEYIKTNFKFPLILDAYAGISAFGICVSDCARKVVSIEENTKSVELAKESIKLNKITNLEIHSGDAGEYFTSETRKFDVIILDPPRKGCSIQSLDETLRLCQDTIIYVSCNPTTLARDLKYLKNKGCKIESVKPFDMFCHTYHIENVAIIKCE